jgi:threonine dehydratase
MLGSGNTPTSLEGIVADTEQLEMADLVDEAFARLAGNVARTPLQLNERLSQQHSAEIWLKREDLQLVRSYKLRGAYNLLVQLSAESRRGGVVCASAGNHGQGVAYACGRLEVQGRIYLPRTTPRQKRDRITAFGGRWVDVRVVGDTYDDAATAAASDASSSGATLVPAFDDLRTIAGQGTVAVECVAQLGRAPDVVVVPVGGGGLVAGIAAWLQVNHPTTKVIGVEPAAAASMTAALQAGHPVALDDLDSFVDGAAVRQVGDLTLPLTRDAGVQMVSVLEGQICSEMLELYQTDGIIAEPAGALATAVLGHGIEPQPGSAVVCLLSGGNNDVSRYGEVIERSLVHEGLKHYFLVDFPQEPGALRRFLNEVLGPEDDITLFEYVKRNNRETGPALVGIEIGAKHDLEPLLDRMAHAKITVDRVDPDSTLFRYLR